MALKNYHRMTQKQFDQFVAAGCTPTCHNCREEIPVGKGYAMITFGASNEPKIGWNTTVEVMVCNACADEHLPENEMKRVVAFLSAKEKPPETQRYWGTGRRGCMIVNGEVVPGLSD